MTYCSLRKTNNETFSNLVGGLLLGLDGLCGTPRGIQMSEKIYYYLQPQPEPEWHEWQYRPEIDVPTGYGPSEALIELYDSSGWECPLPVVHQICTELLTLTSADGVMAPTQSEVDLCVVDNWYACHESGVDVPDLPGWVQVRACDSQECSDWSNPRVVDEFPIETGIWLGVCVCLLLTAMRNSRPRGK